MAGLVQRARDALRVFAGGMGGEVASADTRRSVSWGFQWTGYNPDELASRKGGLKVYDEMRHDYAVRACMALLQAAIIGPGWCVEGCTDDPGSMEAADALEDELLHLTTPMAGVLSEMLTALRYGFSLTEKVWDDQLTLTALKVRAPHAIDFAQDTYGNVLNIMQRQAGAGSLVPLPPAKFIHLVHQGEFSNPYGLSHLRSAYNPWWHKTNWLQWMAIWGEKLADQPVKATYPRNTDPGMVNATVAVLENMQANTVLALPEGWDVGLLESTRNIRDTFVSALDRLDLAIARALLVPEKIGFGGGSADGGSYSLSQTQLGAFFFVLHDLRQQLADTVQRQLVDQWAAFHAVDDPPEFKLQPLTDDQRLAVADLWTKLVAGDVVLSDVRDENHVRALLGFPDVEETEDEMRAALLAKQREQAVVPGQPNPNATDGGNNLPPGEGDGNGSGDNADAADPTAGPDGVTGRTDQAEKFWRPLTGPERRADMREKRTLYADQAQALAVAMGPALRDAFKALRADVVQAQGLHTPEASAVAIKNLSFPAPLVSAIRTTMAGALQDAYTQGANQAATEISKSRRMTQPDAPLVYAARAGLVGKKAREFFKAKAFYATGVLLDDVLKQSKQVLFNALKMDKTPGQVLYELDQVLNQYLPTLDAAGREVNVPARIETIARTNTAEAINEGRWAQFTDPEVADVVAGVQYSAVLDDRTRESHAAWDGVTLAVDDPAWFGPPDNRPPNGFNCRCLLVPVTLADGELSDPGDVPSQPAADEGFK